SNLGCPGFHISAGGIDLPDLLAATLRQVASQLEQGRVDALARQPPGRRVEVVQEQPSVDHGVRRDYRAALKLHTTAADRPLRRARRRDGPGSRAARPAII